MNELQRVQLAHEGMRMLLCSQVKEAEELFKNSRNLGPELNAGYSLVQLTRAMMSFDDEAMDFAYKCLETTESYCEVGGKKITIFSSSVSKEVQQMLSAHDKLHCKAIIADCILFESVLVFLKQGLTSYVKGGYLLRKAYKIYKKIFDETEQLCKLPSPISKADMPSPLDKHVGSSVYDKETSKIAVCGNKLDSEEVLLQESLSSMNIGVAGMPVESITEEECSIEADRAATNGENGTDSEATSETSKNGAIHFPWNTSHSSKRASRGKASRPLSGYALPETPCSSIASLENNDTRLRGAVYFGYGLMNIIMSLIPPKLMKLANLFGFNGDRRVGLEALEFSSNSQAMNAPLARIALLWYHTVIRPFFALDGEEEAAGTEEATRLLDAVEEKYPNSALFLFFRGKVCYLHSQLPDALAVYTEAAKLARDQREIEHVVLYEQGWIHFLQLDYEKALTCYVKLKNETRWSACYYAYLSAILSGVQGNLKQSRELFLQSTKLVKRKNNNLEKFCSRRGSHYKLGESPLMDVEVLLFCVEVIYLWRALPFCSVPVRKQLLDRLSVPLPSEAQAVHKAMQAWLRGGILSSLNNPIEAEKSLREALRYDGEIRNDKHILSFSLYEIAMLQIGRNEFARARNTLNLAKESYNAYEFEARLNFKVHSAMSLCP